MGRHAFLVGVSRFDDERLARLNAPAKDVEALGLLLKDPRRGGFDTVITYLQGEFLQIRDRLNEFFENRNPEDLLLFYYSGHGILERGGRLYLASATSNFDRPRSRSIAASELRDIMEASRAAQQIVILDCCHSGAFTEGSKGAPAPVITGDTFITGDAGQYVLAAADTLQFAYDAPASEASEAAVGHLSRFTSWLVEGIDKGEAAPDDEITMDALYEYLRRRARSEGGAMRPQRFVSRGAGGLVISRNPAARIAAVDASIAGALESEPDWMARLGAVTTLGQLIREGSAAEAAAARRLLRERLTREIHFRVVPAIRDALAESRRSDKSPAQESHLPLNLGSTVRRITRNDCIWQRRDSGADNNLFGIYFHDAKHGWVVGGFGAIVATTDGGATWKKQNSGTSNLLRSVCFTDAMHGCAVGEKGTILISTDGGATWQQRKGVDTIDSIVKVQFIDAARGRTVGFSRIQATANGGATWEELYHVPIFGYFNHLTGGFFADAIHGWAIGSRSTLWDYYNPMHSGARATILGTIDGGTTWHVRYDINQDAFKIGLPQDIHFPNAIHGWVVGTLGMIIATADAGGSWQMQDSRTNTDLKSVCFVDIERGWAVGAKGTILATVDGGATWEKQNSGTDNDLACVHFANLAHGWVVGEKGTILAAANMGTE